MENQLIEVLPAEVAQIAQNVSVEKRNEVQSVLNHVFNGVSKMREQLETIVVQDYNDKTNMKLANTIRLGVRQVRLDAEKIFDAKRAEVQAQMLSYKTEDQLWLKAKQTMQILTKEIEENARWKEETRQRFEAEQKELKIQQRIVQVAKFASELQRAEFENMSDDSFNLFVAGIEKQYNDRIEAERKAEEERIAKEKAEAEERERFRIENERLKAEAEAKEKQLVEERAKAEAERKALEEKAKKEKAVADAKLKAEAEAKEKQLAEERAKAEAERKAIEEKARKEKEEAEKKAQAERAKQDAILKAEREAKEKLEAELKAKAEAEQKAKKEAEAKAAAELKAKQDAEKKAKAAPDKAKLNDFAKMLDELALPELKSEEANKVLSDAKTLLAKVSNFIREKSSII